MPKVAWATPVTTTRFIRAPTALPSTSNCTLSLIPPVNVNVTLWPAVGELTLALKVPTIPCRRVVDLALVMTVGDTEGAWAAISTSWGPPASGRLMPVKNAGVSGFPDNICRFSRNSNPCVRERRVERRFALRVFVCDPRPNGKFRKKSHHTIDLSIRRKPSGQPRCSVL